MRKHVIHIIIVICALVITFKQLPATFFQQDEWWAFGIFIKRESTGGIINFLRDVALTSGKVHFNPLTELGLYLQYKVFYMNFTWYAWVSIATHILNVLFVYLITTKIIKNKYFSFLASLLFGVNSISHQAVSWIAASLNTEGSTLLFLISTLLFLEYFKDEKNYKKVLYFSYASFTVALLFKEIILSIVILPVLFLYYSQKKTLQHFINVFLPFAIFIASYAIMRIVIFYVAHPIVTGINSSGITTSISQYILRIVLLPFRIIAQSIIPSRYILQGANAFTKLAYPYFVSVDGSVNPYFSQTIVYDLVCVVITTLIIFATYLTYRIFTQKRLLHLTTGLIVSIFIIIGGALPIIFISDRAGFASIFEPRHLYTGIFGASMLIVLLIYGVSLVFNKKHSIIVLSVFILFLSLLHISLVNADLKVLKTNSDIRKSILHKIELDYQTLPNSVIFYTKSDQPYYGLPEDEKILPVQVGFGRILLVWFQRREKFPACMFDDTFLLDLVAQGYKECDGRGFGYVRKYETLIDIVRKNKLTDTNVIGYSWEGKTEKFYNITSDLRKQIYKDLLKTTL